jgi:hypothetical protein
MLGRPLKPTSRRHSRPLWRRQRGIHRVRLGPRRTERPAAHRICSMVRNGPKWPRASPRAPCSVRAQRRRQNCVLTHLVDVPDRAFGDLAKLAHKAERGINIGMLHGYHSLINGSRRAWPLAALVNRHRRSRPGRTGAPQQAAANPAPAATEVMSARSLMATASLPYKGRRDSPPRPSPG